MDRVKKMIELKDRGLSYRAIGVLFGVSAQRVNQLVKGLNHRGKTKWFNLTKIIKMRDNYICQICGTEKKKDLIVHHIDEVPTNDEKINLITLCRGCHCHLHLQKGPVDKTKYPNVYKTI